MYLDLLINMLLTKQYINVIYINTIFSYFLDTMLLLEYIYGYLNTLIFILIEEEIEVCLDYRSGVRLLEDRRKTR